MKLSKVQYANNMHGHFKILLIQVKNLDDKKLFLKEFEEAFTLLDKEKMWSHIGALVKYNREQAKKP